MAATARPRSTPAHLADLNNDHVLSPDGKTIYVSSDDGHLYAVPIEGGEPRRVSNTHTEPHHYYLHGISPDGKTLVYTCASEARRRQRRYNIWTIPATGGPDTRLTDVTVTNDGPEYSPDGNWICFNTDCVAQPGHAQICRMRPDGTGIDQLTFDERVNWFPHFSPDGQHIVYLSYPEGTVGHPRRQGRDPPLHDARRHRHARHRRLHRRPGHHQRQLLGPRQHPLRLRRLPH